MSSSKPTSPHSKAIEEAYGHLLKAAGQADLLELFSRFMASVNEAMERLDELESKTYKLEKTPATLEVVAALEQAVFTGDGPILLVTHPKVSVCPPDHVTLDRAKAVQFLEEQGVTIF